MMPTFITRGSFSTEGVRGMVAKPEDREAIIAKLVEAAGGKLLHYYFVSGKDDFLLITEGADAESAVAAGMAASASGAISHISTARAWTTKEFAKVAEKAGKLAASYRPPGKA